MSVAENDVQGRLEGVRCDAREGVVNRARPLPWLGKRLLLLAFASGSAGYAFHLFGTWPFGVVAIATPILGWITMVLAMQRQFAVSRRRKEAFSDEEISARRIRQRESELAAQMDWKRRFGT